MTATQRTYLDRRQYHWGGEGASPSLADALDFLANPGLLSVASGKVSIIQIPSPRSPNLWLGTGVICCFMAEVLA